jgi:hypothetical protein
VATHKQLDTDEVTKLRLELAAMTERYQRAERRVRLYQIAHCSLQQLVASLCSSEDYMEREIATKTEQLARRNAQ